MAQILGNLVKANQNMIRAREEKKKLVLYIDIFPLHHFILVFLDESLNPFLFIFIYNFLTMSLTLQETTTSCKIVTQLAIIGIILSIFTVLIAQIR